MFLRLLKENAGQGYRQTSVDASYIEGPTPTNSCGFKISQPNIQDAKALHEVKICLKARLHDATKTCGMRRASKWHHVNGLIATCDCRKKVG